MPDVSYVFVVDTSHEAYAVKKMFQMLGYGLCASLEDADIVCFVGGEDVSPFMYEQHPHPTTHTNPSRDKYETEIYDECINLGIPMIGICRGAQLLNVLNGGKLFQDVNNHNGVYHDVTYTPTGEVIRVNSYHHQQMQVNTNVPYQILASAKTSTLRSEMSILGVSKIERNWHVLPAETEHDVEVVYYPNTRCLCFQPHPEYGNPKDELTRLLFAEAIDDTINAL